MSTEMVVNVSPRETRAALLENGVLQEVFIERTRKIDILLGGIFDEYVFYIEPEIPGTIKLKPLAIVRETGEK